MNNSMPSWVSKVIATALITALIGGAFAWGAGVSSKVSTHEKDIAVQKEKQDNVVEDIDEIKDSQRRMEDKLDRALQRR